MISIGTARAVAGAPPAATTVAYVLEPADKGARITLRHTGFMSRETCVATCVGWETSFDELSRLISRGR